MEPTGLDKAIKFIRSMMRPLIVVCILIFSSFCIAKGEITGADVWDFVKILGVFYFTERAVTKKLDGSN